MSLRRTRIIGPSFPFYSIGGVYTAPSSGYVGPLNVATGTSPLAWGGVSALSTAYAAGIGAAVDLHNDGTGTLDGTIYIDPTTGLINIAAATAAAGRGATKVGKVHDQTGSGRHWTQTNNGLRPVLHLTNGPGSKPTIMCDSAGALEMTGGTVSVADPYFYTAVIRANTAAGSPSPYSGPTADINSKVVYRTATTFYGISDGGGEQGNTASEAVWYHVLSFANGGTGTIWVDTSSGGGSGIGSSGISAGAIGWGGHHGLAYFNGRISELGIWSGDPTSVAGAINTNAHTRWGF
jgi:hypothetical protein